MRDGSSFYRKYIGVSPAGRRRLCVYFVVALVWLAIMLMAIFIIPGNIETLTGRIGDASAVAGFITIYFKNDFLVKENEYAYNVCVEYTCSFLSYLFAIHAIMSIIIRNFLLAN